jgi:1-acyl-sn-glycerol-3-phosphate acyltransferase
MRLVSWVCFALQFGVTGVFIILVLPFGYLGMNFMLTPVMRLISWSIFLSAGKIIRVYGKENIKPGKNYLLIMNHASYFDVPAIMTFAPAPSWLGSERFLRIPIFSTFLRFIKYIPVYPGNPDKSRQSIDTAIANSKRVTIGIFPEGTRTPHGRLNPFKKGFVHILRGSNLDVLPITMNGFYSFMPRHRWIINPFVRLEIIVHPAIRREDLLPMQNEDIAEIVRGTISSIYYDQGDWLFPTPSRLKQKYRQIRNTKNFVKRMRKMNPDNL